MNSVAQWLESSKTWTPLTGGIPDINNWNLVPINAILRTDSVVYVAGLFPTAGGSFVNNVACFDINDMTWSPLNGTNTLAPNARCTLFRDANELLAIGDFDRAAKQCNHIARWDGGAWRSLSSGIVGGGRFTS